MAARTQVFGIAPSEGPSPIVGSSAAISDLRWRIDRLARIDFTVLIEGESGSGKELVARHLHASSARRTGPFVALNCAALVESLLEAELFGIEDRTATGVRGRSGKLEQAHGGTLFLDEVTDLSPRAQAKLLRVMQDLVVERVGGQSSRRLDVRVLVATNRSLAECVRRREFRADLYYRLTGVEIVVPPLRARREDVRQLAEYFLARYRSIRLLRFSLAALEGLASYDWPGNVRELERVVERAIALSEGDEIGLQDLPSAVSGDYRERLLPSLERQESLRVWASRYARLVLSRHGENKRRACEALGISYHTLQAHLAYRGSETERGC